MRLIDADALKKETTQFGDLYGFNPVWQIIDNAPTVEDVSNQEAYEMYNKGYMSGYEMAKKKTERPQGEWVKTQGEWVTDTVYKIDFKCSECDGHFGYPFNFCPNCGARMQKGGKE